MKLYHLYVSAILYAELDFDTQPISIQKLDIASGKLLPWETLSEEDNAFYKSFTKIDLLKLSHQLHSYEQKLQAVRIPGICSVISNSRITSW